ncbi:hypothetical protein VNI00_016932 [Paramarasmius palmivorus]|uniref:Uncharacterized protein n=1 Tax=Paramarasmius palmivorus TaxID=297713 RepID=A0AAW0BAS8_9AGAR
MAAVTNSKKWKIAKPNQRQRTRRRKKIIRVPIAPEERRRIRAEQKQNRTRLNDQIRELIGFIKARCAEMASDFKKKQRYIEDRIFQGGVRMVKPKNKVNAFNAFKSLKAKEFEQEGQPKLSAPALSIKLKAEYSALSSADKEKIVEVFSTARKAEKPIPRIVGRGITQEAANLLANIVGLIKTMAMRVGVEAMLLVTRSRPEPFMEPYWFITNMAYADYLALVAKRDFNLERVGQMMQSFSVAKCDIANMATTVNDKVRALKASIRETLRKQAEDCKRERGSFNDAKQVKVHYEHFDKLMTYDQGIVLEGWPFKDVKNLSSLSSSVRDLTALRSKLDQGSCRLRLLSSEEWKTFRDEYDRRVADGEIEPPKRSERCDVGQKRGPKKKNQKAKPVVEIGGLVDGVADGGDTKEVGDSDEESGEDAPEPKKSKGTKGKAVKRKQKSEKAEKERPKPKKITSKPIVVEEDESAEGATAPAASTELGSTSTSPSAVPVVPSPAEPRSVHFDDDDLPCRPCLDPEDNHPMFGKDGPAAKVINLRDPSPEPLFLPTTQSNPPSPQINPSLLNTPTELSSTHPTISPSQLRLSPSHITPPMDPESDPTSDSAVTVQSNKRSRPDDVDMADLDRPLAERKAKRAPKGPAPRFAETEYSTTGREAGSRKASGGRKASSKAGEEKAGMKKKSL